MELFYLDIRQRGNKILIRYIQDGQECMMEYKDYKPTLYRLAHLGETAEYTELIDSKPVVPVKFDSVWDAVQAIKDAQSGYYYGNRNFNYTFLHENFKDTTNYDPSKIRVFYLDIECPSEHGFPDADKAEWQIDAFTIYDNITDKYYIWSLYEFDSTDPELIENGITSSDIVHKKFKYEYDLMADLLNWWQKNFPVAVTGWNSGGFDLPYVYNRLRKLGLEPNKLSPWNVTTIREKEFQGRQILSVNILGVNDLDYLELYKKNRFITRESYKLGFIGHIELGKAKIDFGEEAKNLRTLHKVNPQKYQVYNIVDVQLVKLLDDKLGFMDITFAVAYFAGINFSDVKSPVMTWNNIMYRNTIDDKVVLPPVKEHDSQSYTGAYVRVPMVGKHKWICSFDLASLYPSLIRQYNISAETITNHVVPDVNVDSMTNGDKYTKPNDDLVVCPSGNTFRKDVKSVANKMMEKLYNDRKEIKGDMLKHQQCAVDAESELKRRGLL